MLFTIMMFILALMILISVHEFGHFWVARRLGVKVLRFVIGFGKPIFSWHDRLGTEYRIAMIPLGGYVKMLDENEGPVHKDLQIHAFNRQSVWRRIAIVLAGPGFNLLFAVFAFWLLFIIGIKSIVPIIDHVLPDTPAAAAELPAGYEIYAVGQHKTIDWREVLLSLLAYKKEQLIHMQLRNPSTGAVVSRDIDLQNWTLNPQTSFLAQFGIKPHLPTDNFPDYLVRKQRYSVLLAWKPAVRETLEYTLTNFRIIGKMLTGHVSLRTLGGPISIAQGASHTAHLGFTDFLKFLAIISISLAVLNILPIPVLDGGHLLYYFIELITGRPLPQSVSNVGYKLGIVALIGIMSIAFYNDFIRYLTNH